MQAIIDHCKRFQDVFVSVFGSMNDVWILRIYYLYHWTTKGNQFVTEHGQGIRPCILGNKGYPFLPWLMVPHKQVGVCHTILETLFNQQLSCSRSIVENSFGILKQMFWEILLKTSLDILFLPNVVICCNMLHNFIMNGKDEDIETLMAQLDIENDHLGASVGTRMREKTRVDMHDEVKQALWDDELSRIAQRT